MCILAPPISSRVVFSPVTISTIRSLPRYIDALPSTITTTSQNAGMYAPPAARRPEQRADLRDRAGGPDLGVEDLAGAAAAGEQVDLVGDPGAGRVHQVDHRNTGGVGPLDDPDDLLDGPGAPGAGLDGGVVGHQADPPAVDGRRCR